MDSGMGVGVLGIVVMSSKRNLNIKDDVTIMNLEVL